jgi:hypothetical protein
MPLVDRLFFILAFSTFIIVALPLILCAIPAPSTLFITVPIFLFTVYFLISPLFGYVELRESTVFIKYGFLLSKEIPYSIIRAVERERKVISPSIMSLKNSIEHVNIKFNRFDITTISVKDNEAFINELSAQINKMQGERK